MQKKALWPTLIVALVAFGGQSLAEDQGEMTRSEKRLARVMEDYKATGETKSCVPLRFLRDSTIIDDQTIFFKGVGKTAYINRMPHRCPRLAAEERFMYSTSISMLCRMEIITVLDSFGRQWGSCGLGEFEEMEKLSKAEKAERDQQNPADDGSQGDSE
ncbi:hypothetical protein [Kordiimonas gwangyangensis]|uniref:hypothetical protein n=1 Tax=Kordiimonas gwangyangensis TaxID=288022 RepID=UPI0003673E9D|nr:hypothetical protein [Kordiimonas gwangyangensis]